MQRHTVSMFAAALFVAAGAIPQLAGAATVPVEFNVLNASATLPTPFLAGDNLRLNTLVTTQTGALLQSITFTIGAGVDSLFGRAAWEVSTAAGPGPRLIGVNIDIFDASNALVTSDTGVVVGNGFATSIFNSVAIGPGTYHMVASGTGVRDSSLDVTLSFAQTVPLPAAAWLLLSGVGALGAFARRRKPVANA